MAATVAKVTFQFKSRGQGFSESYLKNVPSGQVTDIIPAVNALATLMAAIRGSQTNLYRARVSDKNAKRKGFLLPFGAGGIFGDPSQDSEDPNTSLNLRLLAAGTPPQGALRFMRGCWDSVITEGGLYTPTPTFKNKVNAFVAGLVAGGWSFAPAAPQTAVIASIDFAGYTVAGTSGNIKMAKITIATDLFPGTPGSGFQGQVFPFRIVGGSFTNPSLKRSVTISADTTTTGTPLYHVGMVYDWANLNNNYLGGGSVLAYSDGALVGITSATIEGVGKRASGRPSDLQRGRRYTNPLTKLFV
jgi:hypothetical protein